MAQTLSNDGAICYNRAMEKKGFFGKFKIEFGLLTIILLAVFAVLLALDLILKSCEVAFDWNFKVIPNLIYVESGQKNTGAAFSFLANTTGGRVFLIILSCVMFVAVAVFFIFLPKRYAVLKTALVMIGAGAIGNLVDRIALGYVRDFVWMNIFGTWACCNFADFWIVLGAILAVADMLFLNELAILPLTKGAKARVAARKEREESEQAQSTNGGKEEPADITQTQETASGENHEEEPADITQNDKDGRE